MCRTRDLKNAQDVRSSTDCRSRAFCLLARGAAAIIPPMPAHRPPARLLRHPFGWIASGFGSGYAPIAPGTFGSLAALIPWLWLRELPAWQYLAVLALFFAVSAWAADWVIGQIGAEDPGVVVADEWVGQWLALFLAPAGWVWMLIGFALFRLFDVWKPWPVSWADRRLHGGFGAMFDDLLVGLYAFLALQALVLLSLRLGWLSA
jgi:phosphatidylglycerophosphatase A